MLSTLDPNADIIELLKATMFIRAAWSPNGGTNSLKVWHTAQKLLFSMKPWDSRHTRDP